MKTKLKELRGFIVGDNCFFYENNFNLLFWKPACYVADNLNEIIRDGVRYKLEVFSKSRIAEEYLLRSGDASKSTNLLNFRMEPDTKSVPLTINDSVRDKLKELIFKRAHVDMGSELSESKKFSFLLGVFSFINKFYNEEEALLTEDSEKEKIISIELIFDKNIQSSGFCDCLPAVKTQKIAINQESGRVSYSFSWIFHERHAIFSWARGYMSESKLAINW